ncbi:bifunctional aminodeoxychorismate synthase component I/aminotransferase [Aquabacterium olei]|uniref:Bifunctional aminodeoxychorismate synthase component I/aminotransferase n=1 Tax=Aquabacterium olei TaxID=1296669 RepID=A0A2U8FSC5_9BURK|nr:chorismate-binding protein [Aquabacterium olei]AWI53910.1 bifunctional aminodeoxychorismate synthase component I/aminotransferase [Aquabacterium olei]
MLDQDPAFPTALVDFPLPDGPGRARWRFDRPTQWLVAHDPSQVASLLDAAHALAQAGQWCVGWVAYEAAPGLNPHLPVKALPPGQPYAIWAVFDKAEAWDGSPLAAPEPPWSASEWAAELDEAAVLGRVETIRELIRAGEVYQINLTARLRSPFEGGSEGMWPYFRALQRSQPEGYTLMLDARAACRAPGAVLSVSPELFFDWDGETLVTRPMKGTAARQPEAQADARAADNLRSSDKERAENLMIVDLLRNDLSRVAEVGSVRVPSLFDLHALPTVWQMTSTVTARSRAGLRLSEAFAALFPCGSVTGAPKRQAMHHIARLERSARGVYCGAVGLMQPGGRVTFNVPIRTVCLHTPPPPAPWRAECGIGSGITLDATGPGEVLEWQAKRGFLYRAAQPFQLIESLRLEDGRLCRVDRHLARLAGSATHFGWPALTPAQRHDLDHALRQIALAHPTGVHKVRLLLGPDGRFSVEAAALSGPGTPGVEPASVRVALARTPMPPADDFIRHKTTRRQAYAGFVPPPGCFDTLLHNEAGLLTEFTIGNLALKLGGTWCTPPLEAGLLPGVMRAAALASGELQEHPLHRTDLLKAGDAALLNSVRGWVPVDLTDLQQQARLAGWAAPA